MRLSFMGRFLFQFSWFYAAFSSCAVAFAFYRAIGHLKLRRCASESKPMSVEEIFTLLFLSAVMTDIILYDALMNIQCFFIVIPFFFLVQGRFIASLSRWASEKFPGIPGSKSVVFSAFLVAVSISLALPLSRIVSMRNHSDNPMFNLSAQKNLCQYLLSHKITRFFTTQQNHAGFMEFLSKDELQPYHLYHSFEPNGPPVREVFQRTLQNRLIPYYVVDNGKNPFAGFQHEKIPIEASLLQAGKESGCTMYVLDRIRNDRGNTVFSIYKADCRQAGSPQLLHERK